MTTLFERKHFEALADFIRIDVAGDPICAETRERLVELLCKRFARSNPRFDAKLFTYYCTPATRTKGQ